MKNFYLDNRPAFVKHTNFKNDILELDGFVVTITDSGARIYKKLKGGNTKMTREELEYRIRIYNEDLAEAIALRDTIATENVETKIDAKISEMRKEISDKFYAEHDEALANANKDIERMQKIIARRENELAELVATEEVAVEETIVEGE